MTKTKRVRIAFLIDPDGYTECRVVPAGCDRRRAMELMEDYNFASGFGERARLSFGEFDVPLPEEPEEPAVVRGEVVDD